MQISLKIILISLWVVAGVAVGGVAAGVWWYRQHQSTAGISLDPIASDAGHRLDALFDAPAFTLIDQDGKPFNSAQLRGKVWVADFVFTTCTGLCPVMAIIRSCTAAIFCWSMATLRCAGFTITRMRAI